jgi:hypothetical protein
MRGPMKLIDASSGLMECRVCGSRHGASLQSGYERADGVTRYYRGSWQCSNEHCPSNVKEWNADKQRFVKPNWRKLVQAAAAQFGSVYGGQDEETQEKLGHAGDLQSCV